MRLRKEYLLAVVSVAIIISGCKKWKDHVAVENPDLEKDLYTAIKENPTLSKFSAYITQAGLDSVLQSSKTYTVWAPTNDALNTLDPAVVNDPVKLKSFVLNHISNQLYFTRDAQTTKRIGMLNGKYNNFVNNKFEDATVTTADKFVRNGVLHVIDKFIPVLPNLWEYINSTAAQYQQNSFIATDLNFTAFDPSLAIVDSISSSTGLPVYHPGTGIVARNTFNDKVFDTKREDKQYTYFVIANTGFTSKSDSLKPYYATGIPAKTDSLVKWAVVKDLLFDSIYPTTASLPALLVSKFGVPLQVTTAFITDSKKVSNGMVYVISLSGTTTAAKFLPTTIQGESPTGFQSDKTSNTNYRIRYNPLTGQNYMDILVSGHGVTGYYSFYRLNDMPSMKYNVYIMAVNDFQTGNAFESVGVGSYTAPSTYTPLTTTPALLSYGVPLKTAANAFNETLLGTFTSTSFGTLEFRLVSGGSTLGSSGTGPIVADYIRIVPVP